MQVYLMLLWILDIFTTTRLSNNSVHPRYLYFCVVFCIEESSFYNALIVNHSSPFLPSAVSSLYRS